MTDGTSAEGSVTAEGAASGVEAVEEPGSGGDPAQAASASEDGDGTTDDGSDADAPAGDPPSGDALEA